MASKVVVEVHGERHTVFYKPMQPLRDIIPAALTAAKLRVSPADCQLLLGKQHLDLDTPFRFANISSSAKLVLVTGHEPIRGVQPSSSSHPDFRAPPPSAAGAAGPVPQQVPLGGPGPGPSAVASSAQPVQPSAPRLGTSSTLAYQHVGAVNNAPPAAAVAAAAEILRSEAVGVPTQPADSAAATPCKTAASTITTTTATAASAAPERPVAADDAQQQRVPSVCHPTTRPSAVEPRQQADAGSRVPQVPQSASAAATSGHVAGAAPCSFAVRPIIFHRSDWEQAQHDSKGAGSSGAEVDDAFFEFTEADYHAVMSSYARSRADKEAGLRTRAMRDAESSARAHQFQRVPVRVTMPDGFILQLQLSGSTTLQQLKNAVQELLVSTAPPTQWYLFTTPPKQALTDHAATLYALGLVPAASVFLGHDGATWQSYIHPDALSQYRASKAQLIGYGTQPDSKEAPETASAATSGGESSAATLQPSASARIPSGAAARAAQQGNQTKKVPKWLKL